jgi:hypothetical protein
MGLGLQSFEEGEELVRGLVASGRDVRRGDTVQRFLFQLEVGMDVDLGRANVLVHRMGCPARSQIGRCGPFPGSLPPNPAGAFERTGLSGDYAVCVTGVAWMT